MATILISRTVDGALRLDTKDLRGSGFFTEPTPQIHDKHAHLYASRWVICNWTSRRGKVESIIRLVANHVHRPCGISIVHAAPGSRHFRSEVVLRSTPCNYGGVRWWFWCPRRGCARTCRILYAPADGSGPWMCRKCYRLDYESHLESGKKSYEMFSRPMKMWDEYLPRYQRARTARARARYARKLAVCSRLMKNPVAVGKDILFNQSKRPTGAVRKSLKKR